MFDINTAIGHWPFRRLPRRTAGELRQYLQSYGVKGAAVASTPALFYMNSQDANLELAEEIAPPPGLFCRSRHLESWLCRSRARP